MVEGDGAVAENSDLRCAQTGGAAGVPTHPAFGKLRALDAPFSPLSATFPPRPPHLMLSRSAVAAGRQRARGASI